MKVSIRTAEVLENARLSQHRSIGDIARQAGLPKSPLRLKLNGHREMKISDLILVATVLGLDPVNVLATAAEGATR